MTGRITLVVIAVLLLGLVVLVTWKSLGALRHLPRQQLSHRQQTAAALLVASEVLITAAGVLVGYLVGKAGHKGSAMTVGGGITGAFTWFALYWIAGGVSRARRARSASRNSSR